MIRIKKSHLITSIRWKLKQEMKIIRKKSMNRRYHATIITDNLTAATAVKNLALMINQGIIMKATANLSCEVKAALLNIISLIKLDRD